MSATTHFKVEADEHVAWLTLDRSEKRNTMGTAFFKELSEHLDKFDRNANIRVVVIKAEGKSLKLAGLIAECPPLTVQGTKEVILHSRDH